MTAHVNLVTYEQASGKNCPHVFMGFYSNPDISCKVVIFLKYIMVIFIIMLELAGIWFFICLSNIKC